MRSNTEAAANTFWVKKQNKNKGADGFLCPRVGLHKQKEREHSALRVCNQRKKKKKIR